MTTTHSYTRPLTHIQLFVIPLTPTLTGSRRPNEHQRLSLKNKSTSLRVASSLYGARVRPNYHNHASKPAILSIVVGRRPPDFDRCLTQSRNNWTTYIRRRRERLADRQYYDAEQQKRKCILPNCLCSSYTLPRCLQPHVPLPLSPSLPLLIRRTVGFSRTH